MTDKPKSKKSASFSGYVPAKIPGMLINRDPPRGSGWCGTDDCKHLNHKTYNEPAKAVK